MIILGSLNSNKTDLLIEQYVQLIKNGVKSSEILFITLNAFKREKVFSSIKTFIPNEKPLVQTYLGLCYNSILNNIEKLNEQLPISDKTDFTLCGLEVSQNLFLDAVKEIGFKDYISKINLVHQLLRRHALIVNNNLSEKDILEKDLILNEGFAKEANKAIDLFKLKTIEKRAFDYIRQQSLFKWLYENTDTTKNIKYLFIDDYDEQTPACTDFFKKIKPQLQDYYIGLDSYGSSRCGYLCADLTCNEILKSEHNIQKASESNFSIKFEFKKATKRLEMLNLCTQEILSLIKHGVYPDEISIISPEFDNQLKFVLNSSLSEQNIKTQFISGSEKLVDDKFIKSILDLLMIINTPQTETAPNCDALCSIFPILLNIPQKQIETIIKHYNKTGGFLKYDFLDNKFNKNYEKFLSFVSKTQIQDSLHNQLEKIHRYFISSETNSDTEIANLKFLSKQIHDLETNINNPDKIKIINQLKNSIISENDTDTKKLNKDSIIIGTPQKIIDLEIKTKYQFWLDSNSDEWIKQDTGTIYNAWVFSKNWNKKQFTYEDSIKCIENKTKRQLRKLKLLTKEKIYVLSSNYNALGVENNIGLNQILKKQKSNIQQNQNKTTWTFTPRKDQKPVLEYTKGKLALSAVPGAGKTTVLQALITKLITQGTPAENIFVLTYMESAAKTLKDRLSNTFNNNEDLTSLPNISTIHGLALRIIKENGNYSKVNLSENFEICDELLRQHLIREAIGELNLQYDEFEKYDKGISIAKFLTINSPPKTKSIIDFLKLFNLYQIKLNEKNLIDYDDMLVFAVKILQENPEILNHYQNLCHYILEDEAQDSSAIQQKLINLLAQKNKNIVRCGDINQAITATFTNSDTQGFRNFIKENTSIEMNHSQRCTEEIFELANNLIDLSLTESNTKNSFYPIKMKGVEGKNPTSISPISAKIFEFEEDEKNEIIQTIKEIFLTNPKATIAILVRNNFQVGKFSALLKENGIPTLSRSDCLDQSSLFNKILCIIKFCTNPWDNSYVQEVYQTIFNIKEENLFISNLEIPFVTIDVGSIDDENLISLHWELNYWLTLNTLSFEQLALKIGEHYCTTEIEKSNLYIISEIIRKIATNAKSKQDLILKLQQISKRPTIAGLKLFSETDNSISTTVGGSVQVMTMHKSKGDEFEYVFVPELTEYSLGTELNSIKTGDYISFYEDLKSLDKNNIRKTGFELKKEILQENLRLLYVTITRAQKRIFFSAPQKQKKFGRIKNVEPCSIFNTLLFNYLNL